LKNSDKAISLFLFSSVWEVSLPTLNLNNNKTIKIQKKNQSNFSLVSWTLRKTNLVPKCLMVFLVQVFLAITCYVLIATNSEWFCWLNTLSKISSHCVINFDILPLVTTLLTVDEYSDDRLKPLLSNTLPCDVAFIRNWKSF